ncbi:hypothetical protein [Dyadobacter sp. CY356]|uniref:hypothetical protein n=1 Tax=Dyadobacter sp. CY356 TaxID=2906442 RepID=UPI001F19DDE0|nr:hypothetical protein [Dyadobacter sp. CY356]MCF0056189.1 hypothetical protein [Dyadobacter sp. CY356]
MLTPIQNLPEKTIPNTLLAKTGSLRLIVKFDGKDAKVDFSLYEKNSRVFAFNSM